jgi:hypothetical protein
VLLAIVVAVVVVVVVVVAGLKRDYYPLQVHSRMKGALPFDRRKTAAVFLSRVCSCHKRNELLGLQ